MKWIVPLMLLLLSSCAKEQFTVSSLSLSTDSGIHIQSSGRVDRNEKMKLSASFDRAADYSFRLVSPDGDLVWEGSMSGESADIDITPGATFPEGSYKALFYSSEGTEYSTEIVYHGIPEYAFYTEKGLSAPSYTEEFSADAVRIGYGRRERGWKPSENASYSLIEAEDGWNSTVHVRQDF